MKIEVWSDFSCPFCYIGTHNFYLALDTYNDECKKNEQLIFKTYELTPDAPYENERSYYDVLAEKYDVPLDRAKEMTTNASKIAKEAGLTINFDTIVAVSTSIAHRLVVWTQLNHIEHARALTTRLFKAYFENGENIADDQVLSAILKEVGIQDISLAEILIDAASGQQMTVDQVEAHSMEIKSVPFFVFDRTDAISGAQTPVNFYQVIQQVDQPSKIND